MARFIWFIQACLVGSIFLAGLGLCQELDQAGGKQNIVNIRNTFPHTLVSTMSSDNGKHNAWSFRVKEWSQRDKRKTGEFQVSFLLRLHWRKISGTHKSFLYHGEGALQIIRGINMPVSKVIQSLVFILCEWRMAPFSLVLDIATLKTYFCPFQFRSSFLVKSWEVTLAWMLSFPTCNEFKQNKLQARRIYNSFQKYTPHSDLFTQWCVWTFKQRRMHIIYWRVYKSSITI